MLAQVIDAFSKALAHPRDGLIQTQCQGSQGRGLLESFCEGAAQEPTLH